VTCQRLWWNIQITQISALKPNRVSASFYVTDVKMDAASAFTVCCALVAMRLRAMRVYKYEVRMELDCKLAGIYSHND